jgi:hypothetical protein
MMENAFKKTTMSGQKVNYLIIDSVWELLKMLSLFTIKKYLSKTTCLPKTTVVSGINYHPTHSYLAYAHNELYCAR